MHSQDMACLTSSTVALSGTWMWKEFEYAGSSTWMTTVGTDMVATVDDNEQAVFVYVEVTCMIMVNFLSYNLATAQELLAYDFLQSSCMLARSSL